MSVLEIENLVKLLIFCLATLITGWSLTAMLQSLPFQRQSMLWLRIALAPAVGIAVNGFLYFLTMSVLRFNFDSALFAHVACAVVALILAKRLAPLSITSENAEFNSIDKLQDDLAKTEVDRISKILGASACVISLLAIGAFIYQCNVRPHGDFDAIMEWNLKARFLYFYNFNLTKSLPGELFWSHPEYPLLLPSAVTAGWMAIGQINQIVPQLIAASFLLGTASLLWLNLRQLISTAQANLGLLLLLTTPFFVLSGASLIADTPIGFYIFGALSSLTFARLQKTTKLPYMFCGFCCAAAVWTKNEGVLFTLALSLSWLIVERKELKNFAANYAFFLLGLSPGIAALTLLKMNCAPPSYWAELATSGLKNLTNFAAYPRVIFLCLMQIVLFGQWQVSMITILPIYWLMYKNPQKGTLGSSTLICIYTVAFMTAAYFLVFILALDDADRQVAAAGHRLSIQLWPAILFFFFINCQTPQFIMNMQPHLKIKNQQ